MGINYEQFRAAMFNYAYLLPLISKDIEEMDCIWGDYHLSEVGFPHITSLLTCTTSGKIVWHWGDKSILAVYMYEEGALYFPSEYVREVVELECPEFFVRLVDYKEYSYDFIRPLLFTERQLKLLLEGK